MRPIFVTCILCLLPSFGCDGRSEQASAQPAPEPASTPAADAATSPPAADVAQAPADPAQAPADRLAPFGLMMAQPEAEVRAILAERFGVEAVPGRHIKADVTLGEAEVELVVMFYQGRLDTLTFRPRFEEKVDAASAPWHATLVETLGEPTRCSGGRCVWERGEDRLVVARDDVWPKGASEPDIEWRISLDGGPEIPTPPEDEAERQKRLERDRQKKIEEERRAREK